MVEILKDFFVSSARKLVTQSCEFLVLYVYQFAVTRLKLKMKYVCLSQVHLPSLFMKAHVCINKFVLQSRFVKIGDDPQHCKNILDEPLSIPNKKAPTLFADAKKFFVWFASSRTRENAYHATHVIAVRSLPSLVFFIKA